MCGRNSLLTAQPELESPFDPEVDSGVEYGPRFNIAPGHPRRSVAGIIKLLPFIFYSRVYCRYYLPDIWLERRELLPYLVVTLTQRD